MKGHWIWMVIGCGLPLLLIFFAPALGITGNNWLFAFIILMFVFHLFMPHGAHGGHAGHGGHNHAGQNNKQHEHGKEKSLASETNEEHKGHSHH
ncbi:hypothetical protein LCGC14_1618720 [marine sediment metagenome]|uniref:DUF2933 domain-containing protein n=2 Tax=root TaxID=1 RepID=A0A831VTB0_9FLAO|nr:hypothetical protein [Pricia antarctica]